MGIIKDIGNGWSVELRELSTIIWHKDAIVHCYECGGIEIDNNDDHSDGLIRAVQYAKDNQREKPEWCKRETNDRT